MGYANGYMPASLLAHAANGTPAQSLEIQTAKQWAAMAAGAAKDGVTLRPQSDGAVASCYRSFAGQVRAAEIEAHGGPTAATPGYSNHGLGTAIDIYMGPGVFAWLSAHAAEYGFDNVQGKASGENWHWVRTKFVAVATAPAAVTSEPLPTPSPKRKKLPVEYALIKSTTSATIYLYRIKDGAFRSLKLAEYQAVTAQGIALATTDPASLSAAVNAAPKW